MSLFKDYTWHEGLQLRYFVLFLSIYLFFILIFAQEDIGLITISLYHCFLCVLQSLKMGFFSSSSVTNRRLRFKAHAYHPSWELVEHVVYMSSMD